MTRQPHAFSVELAELYGVDCAILIAHFQFWIEQNQRMGRNFHDGRTWMYQTQKEIAVVYPYWSEDAVFRSIKKLLDLKVLVKGNYNKTPFDKTIWYAFENEEMFTKPRNRGIDTAEPRNQIPRNRGIRNREIAEPIPDTNTDAKQEQQQAGAVFPRSQEKTIPESLVVLPPSFLTDPKKDHPQSIPSDRIYPCLEPLPIKRKDKIHITKRHSEEIVIKGVKIALAKKNPPRDLAAFINWACSQDIDIPEDIETITKENMSYVNQLKKNCIEPNICRMDILSQSVEFIFTTSIKQPIVILFSDTCFREKLNNYLKQFGFTHDSI